jgi:hypothetical protein
MQLRHSAAAIFLAAALAAAAQDSSGLAMGGSVLEQAYASYSQPGGLTTSGFGYGSSTTLGLSLDAKGQRARASASLETAVLDGTAAQAAWLLAKAGQVPTDELFVYANPAPTGGPGLMMAARIRTLYVKLDADWASLIAGRQVINYQRGAIWSPTDIFTRLDLTGLSPVRLGSDALRLTFPLGATSGLDIAGVPGTDPAQGSYSARLSGLVLGVDGALSASRDGSGKASNLGVDFKADLGLGFYGDFTYALPDSGASGNYRAAGGADWSFGDFIVAAEYYYNGGGPEADLLFPDSHNVYGDITWRASELLDVSLSVIWDISGESGTGILLASLSAAQNATLSVYGKAIWGEGDAKISGQGGAAIEVSF